MLHVIIMQKGGIQFFDTLDKVLAQVMHMGRSRRV